MKKILVALVVLFNVNFLTSCTDNTKNNLVKENARDQQKQNIDPKETGEPGEDDNEEG